MFAPVKHAVGQAIVHAGHHIHGSNAPKNGRRLNLVIWVSLAHKFERFVELGAVLQERVLGFCSICSACMCAQTSKAMQALCDKDEIWHKLRMQISFDCTAATAYGKYDLQSSLSYPPSPTASRMGHSSTRDENGPILLMPITAISKIEPLPDQLLQQVREKLERLPMMTGSEVRRGFARQYLLHNLARHIEVSYGGEALDQLDLSDMMVKRLLSTAEERAYDVVQTSMKALQAQVLTPRWRLKADSLRQSSVIFREFVWWCIF